MSAQAEFSAFLRVPTQTGQGQNDFPIWLVRAERLPRERIVDETHE